MIITELIALIGNALPSTGYVEIADRVNARRAPGDASVTVEQITSAIAYIRRHAERLGWTIPHCRRGKAISGDERLHMLLVDHTGDYFVAGDERRHKIRDGLIGTLTGIAQSMANESYAIRLAASYERSPARKRLLRAMLMEMVHVKEKAEMVSDSLREERMEEAA